MFPSVLFRGAGAALLLALASARGGGLPYSHRNQIPPRLQWEANGGYCGEVSLISAGLYYGQYLSQFDARACAIRPKAQNQGELLLGSNAGLAAARMHLRAEEWTGNGAAGAPAFLQWVKRQVLRGRPVAIGVFNNESLLYGKRNPRAGDPQYDHIVPVVGIRSGHPLRLRRYFGTDRLTFSDNGLWGHPGDYPYFFSSRFDKFPRGRAAANDPAGPLYSLPAGRRNYGIAILGVLDPVGDTLPVRVRTSRNDELPAMPRGSDARPPARPLMLEITVSGLRPGASYRLYRYDRLDAVPDSRFNAHAAAAAAVWDVRPASGSTFTLKETIRSDQTAVYRAVAASAP